MYTYWGKSILPILLCLLAAGLGVSFLLVGAANATDLQADVTPGEDTGLRILETTDERIVMELILPEIEVRSTSMVDQQCDLLHLQDFGYTDQPGLPQLPVRGAMLGIPHQAQVSIEVLDSDVEFYPTRLDLCPVPEQLFDNDSLGTIQYRGSVMKRDPIVYATDQYIPAEPVEIETTGVVRGQKVAQVRFQPIQYNPISGEVRYYKRLLVAVHISNHISGAQSSSTGIVDAGSFEALLRTTLLNYEQARKWRAKTAAVSEIARLLDVESETTFKILVDRDGIYEVTYERLQQAGVPVDTLDENTLRLLNQGQETAIWVEDGGDGTFGPGDYFLFYGQKVNSKYTDVNVYWLTWGSIIGSRMPTIDGTPGGTAQVPSEFTTTAHLEQNSDYQSKRPSGSDNDRWYWETLYGNVVTDPIPVSTTYSTVLNNIATVPVSITVRGLMKGYHVDPFPLHHTRIYLNESLIEDAFWPYADEHFFEEQVDPSVLVDGENLLAVELPLDSGIKVDMILVNWFEIDYSHTFMTNNDLLNFHVDQAGSWEYQVNGFTNDDIEVYDVTDALMPTLILSTTVIPNGSLYQLEFEQSIGSAHQYIALTKDQRLSPVDIIQDETSDLKSATNGADYIIISHGDFITELQDLADWRSSQGLRVTTLDVQDVYDEFNAGVFDPEAIRSFLSYAYSNWIPPEPLFVLLVGDGNYDFKDYLGRGEPNYIPPYLADVDHYKGETAADNRYVSVDGGDDFLPDMHIGRLPVKTATETAAMVSKILNYEQNPPQDGWNSRVTFIADDADDDDDFALLSDDIADNSLPSVYQPEKIYYGVTHDLTDARAAIIEAINQGSLFVNYIGHSGVWLWAAPVLFERNNISALTNNDRLPVMVPMTCLEGYFIAPSLANFDLSSLGESIVRAENKGAIASWSPSGMDVAEGHEYLNKGLYSAVFDDGVTQIGPATTQAKYNLYNNTSSYRTLIDTYILFGDPATELHVLDPDLEVSKTVETAGSVDPGDLITYTLTYSNVGGGPSTQVVISDTLSSTLINTVVSSSGASITQRPGSRYVWDVEDLSPGEGGMITITAQVDSGFGELIVNTATIAGKEEELQTGNNKDEVNSTVGFTRTFLPIINR